MKTKIESIGLAVLMTVSVGVAALATGCAGDRYNRSTGEYIDDKSLNMRVKGALADNTDYKFPDVIVSSFRGVVQLSGFVNTRELKGQAESITKGVQGVKSVDNKISVK